MEKVSNAKQIDEFRALWHQILEFDQTQNVEQLFPHFVGLSTNEISVISMVADDPQIILKDICTRLNMPKSTLTNTINRLEKKGYLTRTIARQDLRSYGLVLTELGIKAQKEHKEYETVCFAKVMDALSMEEQEQLLYLMKKIITSFK